jgi:isopenicillin-N N-acyltransferase-like protein
MKIWRFIKRLFLGLLILFVLLIAAGITYLIIASKIGEPVVKDTTILKTERTQLDTNFYALGNNRLKKAESGLWEMYLEGDGFERGVAHGKLGKELLQQQESYFVASIKKIMQSEFYQRFLKYFIGWFNRNLPDYVNEEYKQEIFGVSQSASEEFDCLGSNYQRMLNYHAAQDIGFALCDKNTVVGGTSFAVWNADAEDSVLTIGRNFDFYVGDDFAKDKIVCFYNPDSGHKFMTITWTGFTGAVSGMNIEGLTVTINAAKSQPPLASSTPISLVAREILQYASTIDEAFAIAKKRQTFVSESILIGSAKDNSAALIEKSPKKTVLFKPEENRLICTNHFQSPEFASEELHQKQIKESASAYRYKRMEELLNESPEMDVQEAADILRDRSGLGDSDIGMGNEKAVNQLLAHHSVIFQPAKKLVWVSTSPFQLGDYVCYNLDSVFSVFPKLHQIVELTVDSLLIWEDDFVDSKEFEDFLFFKDVKNQMQEGLRMDEFTMNYDATYAFEKANPEYYLTYWLLGDYYSKNKQPHEAEICYEIALSKEIATNPEKLKIEENLKQLQE